MMRNGKITPIPYVYVRRESDGYLLHGISPGESKAHAPIVIWKTPGSFDWARRFSTVDNAEKCIRDYRIEGAVVIDRAGRVLRKVKSGEEVRRYGIPV